MNRPYHRNHSCRRDCGSPPNVVIKIIGRFKMVTAKQINALRETSGLTVWQRNYYEHVVRDEVSLNRIRQYIADNPAQWEFDRENPAAGTIER